MRSLTPQLSATPSEPGADTASALRVVTPGRLVAVMGIYLALAWVLVVAIDVADVAGSGELLRARSDLPLWVHLFQEGGLTEWFQWLLLAGATVVAARLSGRLAAQGHRDESRFWVLLGSGTALMLIEDAGNPRHVLADYAQSLVGVPSTLVELTYYAALGSVLLYALIGYGRHALHEAGPRRFLLAGFVAYGIASIASATRHIGEWYARVGDALISPHVGDRLVAFELQGYGTGFWILDFVVEESIELMGATALCAAALAAISKRSTTRSPSG